MSYPIADMEIQTGAGPLTFRRTYVSSYAVRYTSPLGYGWIHNQDIKLIFPAANEPPFVQFKHSSGNLYQFWDTGQGRYTPYAGYTGNLVKNPGTPTTYTLTDQAQNIYAFNQNGKITSLTNSTGHAFTYTYDGNGRLSRVSADSNTRYFDFTYNALSQLESVTDHTGRSIFFAYDAAGDLSTHTDVLEQTWSYSYTSGHLLEEVTDPDGVTKVQTTYISNETIIENQVDINFNNYAITEFANQDGNHTITIEDGGMTLKLSGNTWKKISLPYTITDNTFIEFDFKSTAQAEVQGVGMETDNGLSANRVFQVYGTQAYGLTNYKNYAGNSPNWKHYVIPVGQFYQGSTIYFIFANDHDVSNPTGVSYYANVKVYDETPNPLYGYAISQHDGEGNLMASLSYNGTSTTITDALSNDVIHAYDDRGTLVDETDPLNASTDKTYDANFRLSTMMDASGNTTNLTWSANGANLMGIVDAEGNQTDITYNSLNLPTSVIDPRDFLTTYTYSGTLLTSTTNALNQTQSYTYTPQGYLASVTDPLNHTISYTYDSHGQRISMTDPLNNTWTYAYDSLGRLVDTTDPLGHVTHMVYDAAGHLISVTQNYDSNKSQNEDNEWNIVTTYAYDVRGNQISVTDTLGRITQYEYDDADRLTKTIDPAGNETTNTYNAAGHLIAVTDALNRATEYEYDEAGRLVSTTDALGNITSTAYDLDGTVASTTDALGRVTSYEYDSLRRVITVTMPNGGETHSTYDESGNLATTTDPLDNVTAYEYDALNRLIKTTDALGNETENFYNAAGQLIQTVDARGNATTYAYDAAGRQISITDALGNVTTYEYDALGRRSSVTDAKGNETTFTYDELSRTVTITDALGHSSTTAYDALGQTLAQTDANNHSVSFAYNNLNQLVTQTDPLNNSTTFDYDDVGNRLTVTDANNQTVATAYDALNRPITFTDANNNASSSEYDAVGNVVISADALENETAYAYNAINQPSLITDPLGNETQNVYNARGDLILTTDAEGVVTKYEYDALARLTAVIENYQAGIPADIETNVRTEYTYDENGNRLSILDANGHLTSFAYDELNRLITETDALNHTWTTTYDDVGNRISLTDANGATTNYVYDDANQLVTIDYSTGADVTFTYDNAGRRLTMTDGLGTTTWAYNARNEVTSVTDPFNKTVGYDYDDAGNKTTLTYPNSQVVSYSYDPANRLTTVNGLSTTVGYTYDTANRLTNITRSNDVDTAYSYDDAGRLLSITHAQGVELLSSFEYTYDSVGNRIQAIEDVKSPQLPPVPTATPTNTPTQAFTPTETSLPTDTPIPTNTPPPTDTPTPTDTLEFTLTPSETPEYTSTPSETPTETLVLTETATNTPVFTPTETDTPTSVPSLTDTPFPTSTFTDVPSFTPTTTPVPQSGPITINYIYDPLYRLVEANYSDGKSFRYSYDSIGNVLEYEQTQSGGTVITNYTYNWVNELLTAQMDNSLIVWEYVYDPSGRLTEVLPDGIAANGARQYTYNTAGYLIEAEAHDGSGYQLQAEMLYDGLGQRLSMTGYSLGTSVTTNYVLDPRQNARPLTATSGGNATVYLYGIDPIAAFTTDWSYFLPDGTNTTRQLTNSAAEITLAGRYTPWGDSLDYTGMGNFTFGYFGGLMDSATGLLYLGNGQYYDPATGRFLTRDVNPNSQNPYVPWNPIGAILAPSAVAGLIYARKRRKNSFDYFVIVLLVVAGVGVGLSACAPVNPPISTTSPSLPPPVVTIETSAPYPTSTPQGKTVYLTFDDGPDPFDYTTDIAYSLQQKNAKGTFFITGADPGDGGLLRYLWVCGDRQGLTPAWKGLNVIQTLINNGHGVGLHGYYHVGWSGEPDGGYSQLTIEEEALKQIGIVLPGPVMVRTPYLAWGAVPIPGYRTAQYYDADIISDDDKGLSAENIVQSVVTQLANHNYPDNPIILLHSTPTVQTYFTIVNPSTEESDLLANLMKIGYTRFEILPRPGDPVNSIIGRHKTGW